MLLPHHQTHSGKWPTWHTILFSYMFISILYMFWATSCSSSGEPIVSIQRLVYVTPCTWSSDMQVRKEPSSFLTYISDGHVHRVTYTRRCIDTIDSPDDEHEVTRNVEDWNKQKEMCVKLVIYQNYTEMHGQQNLKSHQTHCLKEDMQRNTTCSFHWATSLRQCPTECRSNVHVQKRRTTMPPQINKQTFFQDEGKKHNINVKLYKMSSAV
jgi:hypothetical protein